LDYGVRMVSGTVQLASFRRETPLRGVGLKPATVFDARNASPIVNKRGVLSSFSSRATGA